MEVETLETVQTDAADIAASLSANAPTADEAEGVDNTPTETTEAPKTESNLTSDAPKDSNGHYHDPNIHQSPPKLTTKGVWMKKRGRGAAKLKEQAEKPAAKSFVASPSNTRQKAVEQQNAAAVDAQRQDENKAAAIACTQAIFTIGQAVGGPKFAPGAMVTKTGLNRQAETANMQDNFYGYFESTGEAFKLPAWAGLAIALGAYGAARMGDEDVQKHVKRSIGARFLGPVGRWWKKRGDRKAAKKAVKAEQKAKTGIQPVDPEDVLEANGLKAAGFA